MCVSPPESVHFPGLRVTCSTSEFVLSDSSNPKYQIWTSEELQSLEERWRWCESPRFWFQSFHPHWSESLRHIPLILCVSVCVNNIATFHISFVPGNWVASSHNTHTHIHTGKDFSDGGIWRLMVDIMWLYNVPPDTGNSQRSGTECVCVWEEKYPSEGGNNESHCGFSEHKGPHRCTHAFRRVHASASDHHRSNETVPSILSLHPPLPVRAGAHPSCDGVHGPSQGHTENRARSRSFMWKSNKQSDSFNRCNMSDWNITTVNSGL